MLCYCSFSERGTRVAARQMANVTAPAGASPISKGAWAVLLKDPRWRTLSLASSRQTYILSYVPMFAAQIVRGNLRGNTGLSINIQGYMVGNGVTDPVYDGNALVPYALGKSLIDLTLHSESVAAACGNTFWNASEGSACDRALDKMDTILSKLNIYDSFDTCYHTSPPAGRAYSASSASNYKHTCGMHAMLPHTSAGRAWPFRANVMPGPVKTWPQLFRGLSNTPPCIGDSIVRTYLNRSTSRYANYLLY